MADRDCNGRGQPDRVAAAVCWRDAEGGAQFLLVRTTGGKHWTFPKGHIRRGERPSEAAMREADEEAGVRGEIESEPIAYFLYKGGSKEPPGSLLCVPAFMLRVEHAKRPAEGFREPTWLAPDEAKTRLTERRNREEYSELHRVIDTAVERLRAA